MKKILLFIVFAGLLLRLYGAGHGLAAGRVFHPDTPKQMMFFNHFVEGDYRIRFRIPHRDYYGYPSFHIHISEWLYRGMGALGDMVGYPGWELAPLHRWLFVRLVTALFSAASIVFVFLIGKELFTEKAGLIGAALFALHPFSVGMSHFIMGDTAMTFFTLVTFYLFALCLKKQNAWLYLAGGVAAGLAAACKYNGAFIIIPGLFALFARPGRKTVYGFAALLFGGALGFTAGNPSMFTHFSEGMRAAAAFSSYTSRVGWDTSQPRVLAALAAAPGKFRMFIGLFGVLQCVLTASALAWMAVKKRNLRTLFAVLFPVSYFFLMIAAYPVLMPLHFLVLTPFLLLLCGRFLAEAPGGRKKETVLACVVTAGIILFQGYASYTESFLFRAGDTRISAEEWLERNTPYYFDSAPYSARSPHGGGDAPGSAGGFYAASGLSGMVHPGGGVPVKEFSHENKIPLVTFRNPDIKILAYYGEELRPGFKLPVFNRPPFYGELHGPLFLNGVKFGPDPFVFFLDSGKEFMAVSREPLEEITVLLVNYDTPAEISLRVSGRSKKAELAPFESKLVTFENPLRLPPWNRYYYRIRVLAEKPGSRVFGSIAFNCLDKGMAYFSAGMFDEAAEYFGKADYCAVCPVEIEIMRALAHKKAGGGEKALGIAQNINYWAGEYLHGGASAGGAGTSFRDLFLANTGISVNYLEEVNAVRFYGDEFASLRGGVKRREEEGRHSVYSHVIECGGGAADVIFGPYMPFPPGNYYARFVFSVRDYGPETEVLFDVSSALGEEVLSSKEFRGADISGASEILLAFSVKERTRFLEFRTFLSGGGAFELEYVEVFPDIKKNALEKARILESIKELE